VLAFDTLAAQQPEWDSRIELTPGARVVQVFTATEDDLARVEVFLVPDSAPGAADPPDTGLRFWLWEGGDPAVVNGEPVRASTAGAPVRVEGPGWFSFDFEPLAASRGRVYTLGIEARGGVGLMAHRRLGSRLKVGGRSAPGSIAFRAVARRSPVLAAHFDAVRESITAQEKRLDQGPLHVRLEIAASCNLACIMCPFGAPGGYGPADGIRFLTLDMFKVIEPLMSRVLTVNAFGLGEPFLSPHFLPILRRTRALNADCVVFCSTNGVTYSERTITAIVAEKLLNVLQVSVDGATKETYERVRVGGRFDQLMKNLVFLQNEKTRLGVRTPSTKVQMVVMQPNAHELLDVTRTMIDLGVDVLRLDTVIDHPELEITRYDDVRRLADRLQEAIVLTARNHVSLEGTLLSHIEDMLAAAAQREGVSRPRSSRKEIPLIADEASRSKGAGMPLCTAPWESFTLAANGDVRLCCNYQKVMGSALRSSFEDVWNGQLYLEMRESLCTGRYEDLCARCLDSGGFMPDQEVRAVYRERRVEAAPPAPDADGHWRAAIGRHVDDLLRSPASLGCAVIHGAQLFDGAAAVAAGPLDVRGELELTLPPSSDWRVAVAVGGEIVDVVRAAPQGRGRWTWRAAADARLFERGANLEVYVAAEREGTIALQSVALRDSVVTAIAPGSRGVVVRTSTGLSVPVVPATASPLIGYLESVSTDGGAIRLSGWALDWRLSGSPSVIAVFANDRFVAEVVPWIERADVADTLELSPGDGKWRRRQDGEQPSWLCTGFFVDLPADVAPWLADAHIRVLQVSPDLGLATEVEYTKGYPFVAPRPMVAAMGLGPVSAR
jgi:MoaA/NifB/PqqE/SkfB family radical SAM enzyme